MPRRAREHRIVLYPGPDSRPVVLARERIWDRFRPVPSQRRFLVSPDGAWLAYAHAESGQLRVRDAGGREVILPGVHGRDGRFSADSRYVAAVAADRGRHGVAVLDLSTGERRHFVSAGLPTWIEWTRGGVVAQHGAPGGSDHVLTYLPLAGTAREIARAGYITRFTAAARGSRVVYFAALEIFSVDVERPEKPRHLGTAPGAILNAEMSPDGHRVAFVDYRGVHVLEDRAAPRRLDALAAVHSLWFSPDGKQLAWASNERATVLEGTRRWDLPAAPGDFIRTLRLRKDRPGLIVVGRDAVRTWLPGSRGRPAVLGRAPRGDVLEGADAIAGGVAIWTAEPWSRIGWRRPFARRALHNPLQSSR